MMSASTSSALSSKVLHAYSRYLLQLGSSFSADFMSQALSDNPDIADSIANIFSTGFDPALEKDADGRRASQRAAADGVRADIEKLDGETQDFFAQLLEVVLATVRTNAYQGKETIALKISTRDISFAPLPKPLFEIFVEGEALEGVHLRFGKVARGGLRWSDRPEDFRTEVLGLVKAQVTKNAVIIPTGSKGGFVPKNLPDRDSEQDKYNEMGVAAYKLFIQSLLDVTDNLVTDEQGEQQIVRPEKVVALDENDHYLVVAADKGTATFSDTANAISIANGFWLGDAFASGGSVGFDHKEMGITARGAWESVKRHFASLGHDSQAEDFTMVGIGGMAGDVFGNGALLSEHIRLIGAFDSRHIFIDPNPDTAVSFAERKRLFDLPRAYWTDYNRDLISAGGGVYSRKDKEIPVTDQMREALGLETSAETLTADELIVAILKAPVDLLYTGGTGTYVRSTEETDAQVGDSSNDKLRITAPELRVRVISEGGNLGLTQRARIEAAAGGILVNTDAIDNSAGVETSDREVNLKILMGRAIEAGQFKEGDRANFIAEQVEEVGRRVLRSNLEQNVLLQAERTEAFNTNDIAGEFMDYLTETVHLDREVELLPSDAELADRAEAHVPLTSPELSVLTAYAKIDLTAALVDSGYADEPDLDLSDVLADYFPTPATEKFGSYFDEHPLRSEIIATRAANRMINHAGITFVYEMKKKHGASVNDIARAFRAARLEAGALPDIEGNGDFDAWVEGAQALRKAIEAKLAR
ncbi:NAD-glutamate dehydrogenase domain-containing protein [Rothia nasimurium]|uniref:NAD-glutamate dehydrogenase domain-containing protein n=1 Tax=Rothia nasimurium TaxID=85336 RepID=UPI001F339816|nr:NAD-glutamate dehydrogenase domain-containing protein [Rothia nasimurium]